jgi:hypothetical protein
MSSVFASLGRLSNPAPFPSLLSALIATLVPLETAFDSRSIRARFALTSVTLASSPRSRATGKRDHRRKRNPNVSESDQNRSDIKADDGNPGAIRGALL